VPIKKAKQSSPLWESNPGPPDHRFQLQSDALPAELRRVEDKCHEVISAFIFFTIIFITLDNIADLS